MNKLLTTLLCIVFINTCVFAAARSINAVLHNHTDKKLSLDKYENPPSHGDWEKTPSTTIEPNQSGSWTLESDGFMTGCAAWVTYTIAGIEGNIYIYCNNPYYGSNSYDWKTPEGYYIEIEGGSGNNANVNFHLKRK